MSTKLTILYLRYVEWHPAWACTSRLKGVYRCCCCCPAPSVLVQRRVRPCCIRLRSYEDKAPFTFLSLILNVLVLSTTVDTVSKHEDTFVIIHSQQLHILKQARYILSGRHKDEKVNINDSMGSITRFSAALTGLWQHIHLNARSQCKSDTARQTFPN